MVNARQILALPPTAAGFELGKMRRGEAFRWHRLKEPTWLAVHPRSPLAVEDDLLGDYAASPDAVRMCAVALDHLRYLLDYTRDPTERPPTFAAFTLARAAIEAAAGALWLVGPSTREERLANALTWHAQDDADLVRFARNLTGKPRSGHKQAVSEHNTPIFTLAERLGLPPGAVLGALSSTTILTAAHLPPMAPSPFLTWSAASGFAHGRAWPTYLLQRLDPAPGPNRLRVTTDPAVVLWFASAASALLDHAELTVRALGRPPWPSAPVVRLAQHPLNR